MPSGIAPLSRSPRQMSNVKGLYALNFPASAAPNEQRNIDSQSHTGSYESLRYMAVLRGRRVPYSLLAKLSQT